MRCVGTDAGTFGRWFATAPLFETVGAGFVSACELSNPDNELTLEFFPQHLPTLALQTPRWTKFLERAGMSDTLTRASVLACARVVDAEADVLDVWNAAHCASLRDRAQLVTTTFLRNFAFLKKSIEPLQFDEWAAAMRYVVPCRRPPTQSPPPGVSTSSSMTSANVPRLTHHNLTPLPPHTQGAAPAGTRIRATCGAGYACRLPPVQPGTRPSTAGATLASQLHPLAPRLPRDALSFQRRHRAQLRHPRKQLQPPHAGPALCVLVSAAHAIRLQQLRYEGHAVYVSVWLLHVVVQGNPCTHTPLRPLPTDTSPSTTHTTRHLPSAARRSLSRWRPTSYW